MIDSNNSQGILTMFKHGVVALLCFMAVNLQAQSIDTSGRAKLKFLEPAPQPHKARLIGVSAGIVSGYAASMIGLNKIWYAQYPRSGFHFFNDNGEWNQVDKIGHAWSAYAESLYAFKLYRWAGMSHKKSVWVGGMAGFVIQSGIEVLDGFSEEWGASSGDILANTFGSALLVSQELAWGEQRILLKFSSHPVSYKDYDPAVQVRAEELYGTSFQEKVLKDYNGQTYWLSVNPSSFMKRSNKFPKWLNFAIGYGSEDVFGGFENVWEDEAGITHDFSHIRRYRQYFLSVDVDLTRIKTRSKFLKFLFGAVNVLKIPAPTIEFNSKGKVRFHPFYW